MDDPRDKFLTDVIFEKIEVREYPKIAFLCGGNPEPLSESDSSEQYFQSVRGCVSHLLTSNYTDLHYQNAEDVKDWSSYSAYDDLIEFEQDIAHICKVIVLFVESPGSLAELGSFAIIPEITEKLIVFVHTDFSQSSSFVSLGPLRRINNLKKKQIHYIEWSNELITINKEEKKIVPLKSLKKWGKYTCEVINNALDAICYLSHSSDEYQRTKEAFFIHDIIILFKAITEDEIYRYFGLVQHKIKKKSLRRSLFCLIKLNLIEVVLRGSNTYYLPEGPSASRYLTLKGGKDAVRLALDLDKYYKHSSHFARKEAICDFLGSSK